LFKTLSNIDLRKEAQKPSGGVYYAVPKNKDFSIWEVVYSRNDEFNEAYHEDLWQYVLLNLKQWFGLTDETLTVIKNNEYGLPRGRVQSPKDWIIFHGGDAPNAIKHQVLKAFGLHELNRNGFLKWEESEQEKMNDVDKEKVWNLLKENNEDK